MMRRNVKFDLETYGHIYQISGILSMPS